MSTLRNRFVSILLPVLIFVGTFSAIVATIDDYGLTWDEKCYIENARSIERWFTYTPESGSRFSYESLNAHWNSEWREDLSGNVHPPFIKLSAIVFRNLLGKYLFENVVYQFRVSTAFWTSILVVMIFQVTIRFTGSCCWGLLGGLSFIVVPRFFAEAHFYATDMMITSLGFSGLAVFMFSTSPWTRMLGGGVLFGAALATKFTGILAIAIVAPMVLISDDRGRFMREYAVMALVSAVFFSLFNFPLLFNAGREVTIYFSSFFNREGVVPISTLYFGTSYDFRLPFHQPWVLLGITLPELVVITAGIGIVGGMVRFIKNRDHFSYFSVVPFLLLMTVYMLPATPKHDGIRLLSSAWPFIVLLSIAGCCRLEELCGKKIRIGLLVCIVSLLLSSVDLRTSHPYELSYYNRFIGGSRGAQEKGFIVSYWYDAFNRDFLQRVSQVTGNRPVGVYSYPNVEILLWNQKYGLFPYGLRSVPQDNDYEYILVLNRILTPEMLAFLTGRTALVKLETSDGAFIGGLYQNR